MCGSARFQRYQDAEIAVLRGAIAITLERGTGERLTSSEPLAEVQRALLVVLVLHAPHPEAGGLLGLRKLREHYMSSWDNPLSYVALLCFLLRLAFAHRPARPWAARGHRPAHATPTRRLCDGRAGEGARHKGAKRVTRQLWLVYRSRGWADNNNRLLVHL